MSEDEVLKRLRDIQQKAVTERGEYFSNIVREYPHLELCEGRIPTQDELQALERCPLYDGILIIFNRKEIFPNE